VLRQWDRVAQQSKWWDQKDLASALHLAEAHGLAAPLTALTRELMKGFSPERARALMAAPRPEAG
jgi:3-hydroxyisobutyrate dehydrogenase-like beta-hydroxyacid dehydrogenase